MHLRLLVSRGGMNLARPGIGETGYMLSVSCETSGMYIRFWNTMMNAEENLWSISMYTITAVIYEEKKGPGLIDERASLPEFIIISLHGFVI